MSGGINGVPSELVLGLARAQVARRMTARVEVSRSGGLVDVAGTLDVEVAENLVYRGRAQITVTNASRRVEGDEVVYDLTAVCHFPVLVRDAEGDLEPVEVLDGDTVAVLAAPDPRVVGQTFQISNVSSGGSFPITRQVTIVGAARSDTWTDVTPEAVIEA